MTINEYQKEALRTAKREFLTSIKGISDKTAEKIISAMIEKGGGIWKV